MKKLNDIVANELLYELRNKWEYDYINDCVLITFYSKYQTDNYKIGTFHNIDSIGEYLLEQFTVMGFEFKIENKQRFDNKFIEITIILNM